MKKINYFTVSRELSSMVSTYMFRFVWQNEVRYTYGGRISYYKAALEGESNITVYNGEVALSREELLVKIDNLQKEQAAILSAKWLYDNDKAVVALKTACRGADSADVKKAIATFLKDMGIDSENASRIVGQAIMDCGSSMNCKVLVESEGKRVRKFNANKALSCTMAILFEEMVQAGTIKPVQIPSLLRDKYAKKGKTSAKATATTEKKNATAEKTEKTAKATAKKATRTATTAKN